MEIVVIDLSIRLEKFRSTCQQAHYVASSMAVPQL